MTCTTLCRTLGCRRIRRIVPALVLALAAALAALPTAAQTLETSAKNVLLLESGTNTILFERDPDTSFPPSSMAKMMTAYILFEKISDGSLPLDETMRVSDDAWRLWYSRRADSPSMMFLGAREEVRVEDLLQGIIVSSGNDACTVVAENLAGSEEAFADWMNAKAEALGLTNSHFTNASGWPDPDMHTTARDLAALAEHLIEDFPDLYHYFGERSFTYGLSPDGEPITQPNRNPLLGNVRGADGLKTGAASGVGYALTGSAARDGQRLILVASGFPTSGARARETRQIMDYGFRNFKTYALFQAGQTVEEANVWLGEHGTVPLVVDEDVVLTMSRADRARMTVTVAYNSPIPAPIEKGQPVATVRIKAPTIGERIVPLVAGEAVDELGGFSRIGSALTYLLFGSAE